MSTYALADVIPAVRRIRLPLGRDQFMLLMAALNELLLGLETFLAHEISGTIVLREWIPIIFGPSAAVLLLVAGLIAFKRRMAANILATLTFLASMVVGLLGAYFHWVRAVLPNAPAGEQVSIPLIVWAPPLFAPLMFALVGLLGMSAAWQEDPLESGILVLPGGIRLHMPYSKTQAYFFVVGIGSLFTVISSVLDHARTGFENPWVWVPVVVGVFATLVALAVGFLGRLSHNDLSWYLAAMVLMMVVGAVGTVLHVLENLSAAGVIVVERFLRGAPIFAPLLFANMGLIGVLVMLEEKKSPEKATEKTK